MFSACPMVTLICWLLEPRVRLKTNVAPDGVDVVVKEPVTVIGPEVISPDESPETPSVAVPLIWTSAAFCPLTCVAV